MNLETAKKQETYWTGIAQAQLLGRKIVQVRYLSQEEADDLGWTERPVVIHLDDGNIILPSSDDEGNNAGAMFTNNEKNPTLPVLRD
jgi:hypothetical protein